jgi:hypothetical protein
MPTVRQRWLSAAETQAAIPAMQTIRPNTLATAGTNRTGSTLPAHGPQATADQTAARSTPQSSAAAAVVASACVQNSAERRTGAASTISIVPRSSGPETASLPRVMPHTVAASTTTGSTNASATRPACVATSENGTPESFCQSCGSARSSTSWKAGIVIWAWSQR